jgi:TolB-like protein/DNA-binding winged helix-turn-helix (wHTH) protein/tetratricopeptide (TPR) repeat protein
MKSFKTFRLDTVNHLLWRNGERVPIAPKGFDVLAYLVQHAGRVVTQDEILEELWPETYVNPEVLRKYILEIRKVLGDRPSNPEFIETLKKRGYRFIAPVIDEGAAETPVSQATEGHKTEVRAGQEAAVSGQQRSRGNPKLLKLAIIPFLAFVMAAGLGWYLVFTRDGGHALSSTDTSIAVLPFADMSPTKDQEYFSDGLAEQLINDLAKVSGLKVVARSSAFQFKGKNDDLRDVARKLGVTNILEGSVRREGNHIRITAELIKADDGFQLWSQTYDREIKDIFAVQDEISRAATATLKLKLSGGNGQPIASNSRSANPEAYQAYLQANYFIGRGRSKEDLAKALTYSDDAIKFDPAYAPAWAVRASVQNWMADYGLTDVTEGFRMARNDAERAIALDPASAAGYLALASTQISYDWDWDVANTCLTKAAALEPGSAELFRMRSELSAVLGNLHQAIDLYEQAVALDPLRADSHLHLGYLLYEAGRHDEAQAELQRSLELNSHAALVHGLLGKILIAKGEPNRALAEIDKEPTAWWQLAGLVLAYHSLGREQDSNAALAEFIAKHDTDSAFQIAQAYAFRAESDKSFEWLERAYKQRDSGLIEIKTDPLFNNLRHDARYVQLLKKMRLPP